MLLAALLIDDECLHVRTSVPFNCTGIVPLGCILNEATGMAGGRCEMRGARYSKEFIGACDWMSNTIEAADWYAISILPRIVKKAFQLGKILFLFPGSPKLLRNPIEPKRVLPKRGGAIDSSSSPQKLLAPPPLPSPYLSPPPQALLSPPLRKSCLSPPRLRRRH